MYLYYTVMSTQFIPCFHLIYHSETSLAFVCLFLLMEEIWDNDTIGCPQQGPQCIWMSILVLSEKALITLGFLWSHCPCSYSLWCYAYLCLHPFLQFLLTPNFKWLCTLVHLLHFFDLLLHTMVYLKFINLV
jgi:hypothetical protein